jgi:hypothetical protein
MQKAGVLTEERFAIPGRLQKNVLRSPEDRERTLCDPRKMQKWGSQNGIR